MIHHTYSRSIISLRTSLSFNDCSYYSTERCPSSYCSCCCSFPINSPRFNVPINPSFLYGLRQSTLIQLPPSRRLILGPSDRYCVRSPVSDVGRFCNRECCCFKRERVDRILGKSCKEKCSVKKMSVDFNVNKIRGRLARRSYQCSALGDAEAMLSLLVEESVECLDVKNRRSSSSKDGTVVRKQNVDCENYKHKKGNLASGGQLDRHRLDLGKINSKEESIEKGEEREFLLKKDERRSSRKESSSGNLGSRLDGVQSESSKAHSREENCNRREDGEYFVKEEEHWSRRNESSSSYYSVSDSSDLESHTEVDIQDEGSLGDSSTRYDKDLRQYGSRVVSETAKKDSRRYRDERDQKLQSSSHDEYRVNNSAVWDSRKKSGGIVISEETKKDSKKYIDERNQHLQTSKHDNNQVGSSTEWDWRKKSEKRLAKESAEETKSSKDFVRHSQMSQAHKRTMNASTSEQQFNYQKDESTSGASLHGRLRSHIGKDNQVSEYSKSSDRHEQSTQIAGQTTSNMQGTSNQGDESIMLLDQSVQGTGCKYCKTCGRTMQQDKTQTGFQENAKLSRIRDDVRWNSTVQSQSEDRLRKQGKISTLLQTSVQEDNQQREQMIHVETSQVNTRRKLQNHSETVDTHDNYVGSASSSQQQSKTRKENLEEKSSSLISRQEMKGLEEKISDKVIMGIETNRVAKTGAIASDVHSTRLKINHKSASEQSTYNEQIYSTKVKTEEEIVKKHKYIDETIVQSRLRAELQRPIVKAANTGTLSAKPTISPPSIALISQAGVHQYSEVEGVSELQLTALSPSSDPSSSTVRNESGRITQVGTSSEYVHPQGRTPSECDEVSCGNETYQEPSHEDGLGSASRLVESSIQIVGGFVEEMRHEASSSQARTEITPQHDSGLQMGSGTLYAPQGRTPSSSNEHTGSSIESYEESSHEDALISAERMEESSVQIIGEFVQEMQHETSTSQSTKLKKPSQLDFRHQDENYMLKASTDSEKTNVQDQESRRSSGGSETKQPSDDMWDAIDHFAQESSEMKSSEGTTSENATVKRTGKSMWNVVGRLFRLQWGLPAETQMSSVEEGGHGSSNESATGDAWSSENDAEANGDGIKTKKASLPEELTSVHPLQKRTSTGSRREDLVSDDIIRLGASSSSSVLQIGSLSEGVFSGEITNLTVTQPMSQSTPALDLVVPSARRLRRSHAFEEIEEGAHGESLTGSTGEQSLVVSQTGLKPTSEVVDAEVEQRKLQRSNQVMNVRYHEWEAAYRIEREQRKVDEMFMREALVEAKKAADSWEVPVGAVLVKNGNVIARGYNLVEELRDSTAHAEMICIREASNVLRTWRLSETTLYVTLEPCPMCAGAILQARVGTLVWGAPNKLLGADGSWIRLFPQGMEGEERPEVAEKPAAPLHPFHPNMKIRRGLLEEECADIMKQFFQLRRRKEKQTEESALKPKSLHKFLKFPVIHKRRSS